MFLKDTYHQANEYVERQRIARTPPIYNPARINELPIPSIIPPCRNLTIEFDNEAVMNPVVRIERLNNGSVENIQPGIEFDEVPFEDNAIETGENMASPWVPDSENHENDTAFDEPLIDEDLVDQESLDPLAIIKKELPFPDENIAEFVDDIMHEEVEYERIDDDMSIFVGGEFPLPYINTVQLKENDEFSGNRPFFEFVSKHSEVLIYYVKNLIISNI